MHKESCRNLWLFAGSVAALACGSSAAASGRFGGERAEPLPTRIRLETFSSRVFGNTRMLRVLVPAEYDDPRRRARRYPVLYLNDGQNLFDSSTAVLNPMEWRVDETLDALVSSGRVPPMIVVGIDNAGRAGRFREYFPWVDEYLQPPEPDPQGTRYPTFLVDEVMPFINRRYRTLTGPPHTGLGGSSAGGLAAIYAAVHRPGVFGRLLIESPSIYVDDARILREAEQVRRWPERVYLGAGTNEEGSAQCDPNRIGETELVRDVTRFAAILRRAGVDSAAIHVEVTPCGVHNESAWAARLPVALQHLFGSPAP